MGGAQAASHYPELDDGVRKWTVAIGLNFPADCVS
jgi:hypothetical protein